MLFKRDSAGDLIIASRHPKWSITWAWVLRWRAVHAGRFFYWLRTYRYRKGVYGRISLWRLSFERQPTMRDKGLVR